ncbi:adventurous gliding motility protein CglE [Anaeromyxobacter sp. PSR-1]|uniref:adventurous gliding motility protein CglE n=1 Tax=unclassified Anaeromyxobacter TaxID=2620896 RepID=UPI0005DDB843|nr:adventurous gliding motility protein CglE [Anaeromyxobacter sp. PSR-1]GAO05314.1 hypothetical protein PSR1_04223 [Anaeromyxobacter sp. PSR-1]
MKNILAILALTAPLLAGAQESAPRLQEDPRAARFRDVERGLFVGMEAGYMAFTDTPTEDPAKYPYAGKAGGSAGGLMVGLTLGMDFGNRLSLAIYGQGGNQKGSSNYGAFSLFAGGLDARVALLGWTDRNDWERFFLYVHGRGGYAKSWPEGLFSTNDVVVQGGPGIEYFTRLRHFSVGLAADYVYATKAKASGFAVYPTVRYTF